MVAAAGVAILVGVFGSGAILLSTDSADLTKWMGNIVPARHTGRLTKAIELSEYLIVALLIGWQRVGAAVASVWLSASIIVLLWAAQKAGVATCPCLSGGKDIRSALVRNCLLLIVAAVGLIALPPSPVLELASQLVGLLAATCWAIWVSLRQQHIAIFRAPTPGAVR